MLQEILKLKYDTVFQEQNMNADIFIVAPCIL